MDKSPSILIPYTGPDKSGEIQDVALYLRPETNKLTIESTILRVLHDSPEYKRNYKIVYLANIPGPYIIEQHILEDHYSHRLHFAKAGKEAFTSTMKTMFEEFFNTPFEEAEIIGAYEALERLNISDEELFHLRMPKQHFTKIHNQSIKKYKGVYIVNYDIPAILHKNNQYTNIFAMILRSYLPYKNIHSLIHEMGERLHKEKIVDPNLPISHVFHYSKSPFEQILDGIGYIFTKDKEHININNISFFSFLLSKGLSREKVLAAIKNPIMKFNTVRGLIEANLLTYTNDDSFQNAYEKYCESIQ